VTRRRIVAVAVVAASLAAAGLALRGGPAAAQTTAWTQTSTCPTSGLVLTLRAWNVRTTYQGAGAQRQWSVTGNVTVTAPNHTSVTYAEQYVGQDAPPPEGGGTVVTGTSVQITPGGGPDVVDGVASLSPDGLLGRTSGTTTPVCAALGA